jgi:hypothetical protein
MFHFSFQALLNLSLKGLSYTMIGYMVRKKVNLLLLAVKVIGTLSIWIVSVTMFSPIK